MDTPNDAAALAKELGAHPEQRVWGYVRVSTKGQEDDGYSLGAQVKDIERYCAEQKLDAPRFALEVASAAKPLIRSALFEALGETEIAPRPILQLLLSAVLSRDGAVLLVWKLDRLSRVAADQELILENLRRHKVKVLSVCEGEASLIDTADPTRALMRQILAAFAQYEHALIHMRMETGRQAKAATGGWVGGRPPYGYEARGQELVILPDEARVIRMVFCMREAAGKTYSEILSTLERRGIFTFTKQKLSKILSYRTLYRGEYVDPYNVTHIRHDLRILPDDWGQWDQSEFYTQPTSESTP